MTIIRLHDHPFSGRPPKVYRARSLAHWLVRRYGRRPGVSFQVFAGEPSAETAVRADVTTLMRENRPEYVVLESPGDPVSIIVNTLITMAISAAINLLFAKDPKPLENRTQESPNNQLANRENQQRLLQRVEDIYGTVRSIPTLMMPTYIKYIDHRRVEYGYYCIGRGYYDVTDIRDGDTLLSEITGASAAVYAPFTSPNSGTPQLEIGDAIIDDVLTVTRSSSVETLVLKPMNQLQITAGMEYGFYGPGPGGGTHDLPASSRDILAQFEDSRRPNFAAVTEVGQTVTIDMDAIDVQRSHGGFLLTIDAGTKTYTSSRTGFFRGLVDGSTVTIASFTMDAGNTGPKTVVSHTGETMTVSEALVSESDSFADADFIMSIDYSGTRTVNAVGNGYIELSGSPQWSPLDYPALGFTGITADVEVDNGLVDWTDWFTLPGSERTEVWTNVLARTGMYKDDGSKQVATVEYELQIEQLDEALTPTGVVETVSGSITGATSTERAETLEQATAWTGPCRVRARRTTPYDYSFGGAVVDEITWTDLYGVAPVDKNHFGNKTTVHTVTRSTQSSTSVRQRQLNCLASRKLPTYNGSSFSGTFNANGSLATGTISATNKIVDIIAAVALDPRIGARTLSDLDMAQIWSVQQALDDWNEECGQFNYTFDADNISFEETVAAIANAAFCVPYRQNGKIRLALDRPQASSVALFTHRNKKPNAETITRTFRNEAEYDGVELVYTDPETEKQETIRLPSAGNYTKLKRVEISGIRSYEQAWFRANREYNRLRFQRMSIETVCTADARALIPNARVDIVDNTRFKSWDGDVVAQSGLTLTLSREVEFLPAEAHSIVLMKRDGSLQSIACTAGPEANQVVLAAAPAEAIVTTPTADDGIRTIFSFAADSARGSMAWLVQEIGATDGRYVRVRAVNYTDEYYAADEEAVPAKETVIND
jgi:hypothetical protein